MVPAEWKPHDSRDARASRVRSKAAVRAGGELASVSLSRVVMDEDLLRRFLVNTEPCRLRAVRDKRRSVVVLPELGTVGAEVTFVAGKRGYGRYLLFLLLDLVAGGVTRSLRQRTDRKRSRCHVPDWTATSKKPDNTAEVHPVADCVQNRMKECVQEVHEPNNVNDEIWQRRSCAGGEQKHDRIGRPGDGEYSEDGHHQSLRLSLDNLRVADVVGDAHFVAKNRFVDARVEDEHQGQRHYEVDCYRVHGKDSIAALVPEVRARGQDWVQLIGVLSHGGREKRQHRASP